MTTTRRTRFGLSILLAASGAAPMLAAGCNDGGAAPPTGAGGAGGRGVAGAGVGGGLAGAGGQVAVHAVTVSTATRTPRTATWSVNYWQWAPTYGNEVTGTESEVAALTPTYMRVGGYNNDANVPDPFDDAQLDAMVTYAKAIGAEPILQVPHLADATGQPSTPATGAAMVQYANITNSYGIKYWSVGNEPDLYDTSGLPSDNTQPAIPGYTTDQYCASVTQYVTAMKAVDPTIKIVGPDLAYKYQPGYDWLTPILTTCGDLFDVISIHRYPFEAAMATLPAAEADPAAFRTVMTAVKQILTATGQGSKPLALTEMNVAYDGTTCVLAASPATVGGALWLADSLGSVIQLGLWTSAVWDISDTYPYGLGLIDTAPGHLPRPAYYAYALYAEHFGPTLVSVDATTLPTGVSAYASRNAADDATEVMVVNWNTTAVALQWNVTGLATAPTAPTYLLPAESMAAVEIPDTGAATAWVYGEAERAAAVGPQVIAQGTGATSFVDGGAGGGPGAGRIVGSGCTPTDAAVVCPEITATSATVTSGGAVKAGVLNFGTGSDAWGSYSYAGPGQTAPTATLSADGNGMQISAGFVAPVSASANYEGVGLYYSNSSCLNVAAYTGVKFDFTGTLGGCHLALGAGFSGDVSHADDTTRGACSGASGTCYGPAADVTAEAVQTGDAGTAIEVPFSAMTGGMPVTLFDAATLINIQWQLTDATNTDGGACAANFTVENVSFY